VARASQVQGQQLLHGRFIDNENMGGHGAILGACRAIAGSMPMPAKQLKFYYAPWLPS
jgi:hypothetical protein